MVRLTENFFLKIISEAKMLSIKKITQLAKENSTPLKAKRQAPVISRTQTVNTKSRPLQTARIKKDQGKPS